MHKGYRYKILLPVLGAILLPLTAETGYIITGSRLTSYPYLMPLTFGIGCGFLVGFLLDKYIKTLSVLQETNEVLKKEIARRARSDIKYKALFQENHSVIFVLDPETADIVDANPSAAEFYGYTIEQLRKMNISQIDTLPPEQIEKKLAAASCQKRNHAFFTHRLASGELREVEAYCGPIYIGESKYLLSMINDVTELKLLRGIIPICAKCKQIRDDQGFWSQIEAYLSTHTEADFSHSICPDCIEEIYPEVVALDPGIKQRVYGRNGLRN